MVIYKVTSPSGKVYVGQTKNFNRRKSEHKRDYKRDPIRSPMYLDMRKVGFENFVFEILQDEIETQEDLDKAERYWISFYNSCDPEFGYNQDTGGLSGCLKSSETKAKIGEKTKERWEKEEIASRMLEGLQKGTETVKDQAKENFVACVCKNCGKTFYVKPFEAKHRLYCSLDCLSNKNAQNNHYEKCSQIAAKKAHSENLKEKSTIKEFIIEWALKNREVVMNCPKNKISSTLAPLFSLLEKEYGYKDKRSYYLCFNASNLKNFLSQLQSSI